jgi:hypothetical protein
MPPPGSDAILYFAIKPVSLPDGTSLRSSRQGRGGQSPVIRGIIHRADITRAALEWPVILQVRGSRKSATFGRGIADMFEPYE